MTLSAPKGCGCRLFRTCCQQACVPRQTGSFQERVYTHQIQCGRERVHDLFKCPLLQFFTKRQIACHKPRKGLCVCPTVLCGKKHLFQCPFVFQIQIADTVNSPGQSSDCGWLDRICLVVHIYKGVIRSDDCTANQLACFAHILK